MQYLSTFTLHHPLISALLTMILGILVGFLPAWLHIKLAIRKTLTCIIDDYTEDEGDKELLKETEITVTPTGKETVITPLPTISKDTEYDIVKEEYMIGIQYEDSVYTYIFSHDKLKHYLYYSLLVSATVLILLQLYIHNRIFINFPVTPQLATYITIGSIMGWVAGYIRYLPAAITGSMVAEQKGE